MIAKQEFRAYSSNSKVFLARYRNLNNLTHWHNESELIYVEQGEIEILIDGKNHRCTKGQLILIGNMQVHSIRTIQESELSMIIFGTDLLDGNLSRLQLRSPIISADVDFARLYQTCKEELSSPDQFSGQIALMKVISFLLSIYRSEETDLIALKQKERLSYMELLEDIEKNYSYYSCERGADFLCVSKVYFSSYFHKMSGMTFTDYLNTVRISKAIELLSTDKDKTITEISAFCGFNSIRNFNYTFKKVTGYAPSSLPEGYYFDNTVFRSGGDSFDPTLHETTIVESFG